MAKAKPVFVSTEVMCESFYGTDLDEFIAQLQALKVIPGAKYRVETELQHEWGTDYARFKVTEEREETAQEKKDRLAKARKSKKDKEAADLAEYERLKKKLGK